MKELEKLRHKHCNILCGKKEVDFDSVIFAKLHDVCLRTEWFIVEYDPFTKKAFSYSITRGGIDMWGYIDIEVMESLKVCGLNRICIIENFEPTKFKNLPFNKIKTL